MIINEDKIPLMPGNHGKDCLGNGNFYKYEDGTSVCLCDECDYMMCCFPEYSGVDCSTCKVQDCPRRIAEKQG